MPADTLPASRIEAVVFDVIGTLVDEDSAWASAAERLSAAAGLGDPAALHRRWAGLLDERMSEVVAGRAPWRRHRQLVVDAARDAITSCGGTPDPKALAEVAELEDSYPAWPDVAAATAALRQDRIVAGVSNADLDALARLANRNGIAWDLALSTASVRTFKPAPAAYEYAIVALGSPPERMLFVAAHPWDLRAAREHGFRTAYVARPGAERPAEDDGFDLVLDDLSTLAGRLG
ncbi:haloacid dehalogenase type II [Rathayibacter sp. VKM Ac-2835]|uniref:haloacid dehalogenase type II n=1 Tax=Rathayibacter sp. VKM Ac-2835 TaxID=2739043 RepID=UPI0015661F9F|nr:haloacid dehalogenase type II [Rathayibacter sp. VKM Ac-2835]NRG42281.1 haloacid dehalogenase type II [Rathayibacter sp. VKM Ac-2835]